jgi:hypothetical protein
MDQSIVTRLQGQHPNAASDPHAAQAFVDAYSQEHQRAHGQPFSGQRTQQRGQPQQR